MRGRRDGTRLLGALAILLAACSAAGHASDLVRPRGDPLRNCELAARELGFSVPCPTLLPRSVALMPLCGKPDFCIGKTGSTGTEKIFAMSVSSTDTYESHPGFEHLVWEALPVTGDPPCFGLSSLRKFKDVPEAEIVSCPASSAVGEASATHGEGIHAGHVLGYSDRGGIRYIVSVHGHSKAALQLLDELLRGTRIVGLSGVVETRGFGG
jgi:hypothetical protein